MTQQATRFHLNMQGTPFSNPTLAEEKIEDLEAETGNSYKVVEHPEGGWALVRVYLGDEKAKTEVSPPPPDITDGVHVEPADAHTVQDLVALDAQPEEPNLKGKHGVTAQKDMLNQSFFETEDTVTLKQSAKAYPLECTLATVGLLLLANSYSVAIPEGDAFNWLAVYAFSLKYMGMILLLGAGGRLTYFIFNWTYSYNEEALRIVEGIYKPTQQVYVFPFSMLKGPTVPKVSPLKGALKVGTVVFETQQAPNEKTDKVQLVNIDNPIEVKRDLVLKIRGGK